ncbi:MAG TPA: hypothetical protein VL498_06900 [Terracidiphilus sp.]|jgi:hypothetical protein|nr:hypothetical protein [Terracidiphilus sp.]
MGKFESLAQVEGLPGLSGKLEFEERQRAEYLAQYSNAEDLAYTLVERERQLLAALAKQPARI